MKQQLLALVIALSTSSVWAGGLTTGLGLGGGGSGFYAGASMGKVVTGDVMDDCDKLEWDCYSWKAYGGYKFNKNFGVEGGYYNFIDEDFDVDNGKTTTTSNLKMTGYSVAATASMPLMDNKAEVFGKLGMFSMKAEVDGEAIKNEDGDEKETGALFGVGAGYKLTNNIGVRGEYEHLKGDGLLTGGVTFSTF
ncbi:porin family protein [Thiofilum flexile]|uniref:porin family protein n=1 Tax=Thiofilum flexile TaxID=125627 RepID=UPI00035C98A9|nr:porin family protein [Thiofilum flexile]